LSTSYVNGVSVADATAQAAPATAPAAGRNGGRRWPPVSKARPCPKCGRTDWCLLADDGRAGWCGDTGRTWQDGGADAGGHGIGYVGAALRRPRSKPPAPAATAAKPGLDWAAEHERARSQLTRELLELLAAKTGLPAAAWEKLAPGWHTAADLRRLKVFGKGWLEDYPDGAFAFRERDAGRVVGISHRAVDGRKGAPKGSARGLAFPTDLWDRPGRPVVVVEGVSDVAALAALGIPAVGRPSNSGGAEQLQTLLAGAPVLLMGENDGKPNGTRPGYAGVVAVAQRLSAGWGRPVRFALPPDGAKDVRAWVAQQVAAGVDMADATASRAAGEKFWAAIDAAATEVRPERRSQSDVVLDVARRAYRVGMGDDNEPFAVLREGPALVVPFRGGRRSLRSAVAGMYRRETGRVPCAAALAEALVVLEDDVRDATPESVWLRVGEYGGGTRAPGGGVAIDLGDPSGRAAVVKADGWGVVEASPVLFRRTALTSQLPDPVPAEPAGLLELRRFLNVTHDTFPMVIAWLVAAVLPSMPHAVLSWSGEQGAGKSVAAKKVGSVIDPSPAPLRTLPHDAEQWAVTAAGSWIICVENVSDLPPWASDALCRAVTGDGLVRRQLYSDAELTVVAFRRCVMLTSIDAGTVRGDLADRLLVVDLERIDDADRRPEEEMTAEFEAARPRLLGALLSAAAKVLAALPRVRPARLPRLADFGLVLAALDDACPELTEGRALDLFWAQRRRLAVDVIEGDAVATAIVEFVQGRGGTWIGTAGELRAAVAAGLPAKDLPRTDRGMAGKLARLVTVLREVGIRHTPPRPTDKRRIHRLETCPAEPPTPPGPPTTRPGDAQTATGAGATVGGLVGGPGATAHQPPTDRPSGTCVGVPETGIVGGGGGVGGVHRPDSPPRTYVDPDLPSSTLDHLEDLS
jgi:hypothetical protein